jgi:hypothetical protein
MKNGPYYLLVFFLLFFLPSCLQDKTEEGKILCRINEYNLPVDDFQRQLAEDLELNSDFKLTQKAKRQFLEELIRKELLIQKAKKLKLDRKDKFVRAIERYWESTLIRDLMELKGEEISKRTYISEEEIKARYKKMKKIDDTLSPLSEIHDQFTKELREEKKTRMLKEWIDELRDKANIEINEDLL